MFLIKFFIIQRSLCCCYNQISHTTTTLISMLPTYYRGPVADKFNIHKDFDFQVCSHFRKRSTMALYNFGYIVVLVVLNLLPQVLVQALPSGHVVYSLPYPVTIPFNIPCEYLILQAVFFHVICQNFQRPRSDFKYPLICSFYLFKNILCPYIFTTYPFSPLICHCPAVYSLKLIQLLLFHFSFIITYEYYNLQPFFLYFC